MGGVGRIGERRFPEHRRLQGTRTTGPILQQMANEIFRKYKVSALLVNWRILANPITRHLFGEDGGHATNDETALVGPAETTIRNGFIAAR